MVIVKVQSLMLETGLYTRVKSYLKWIRGVAANGKCDSNDGKSTAARNTGKPRKRKGKKGKKRRPNKKRKDSKEVIYIIQLIVCHSKFQIFKKTS